MRKILLFISILSVLFLVSCSHSKKIKAPYTIAFYNVENLFDTIDAPNKFDEEFTPENIKEWNTEKYVKKIEDLAKVLSRIDTVQLPVVVGLCEVENDIVLNDFIQQEALKNANYEIIWEDGPDFRGIDCALLYNPEFISIEDYSYIPVKDQNDPDFVTRDVLYVKGMVNKEVFHFFVNHWPSRRGGEAVSEPRRVLAAKVVRDKVEQLYKAEENPNIIIMGDMNDEPTNLSLSDVLMAMENNVLPENDQLVNLMYDDCLNDLGSYSYLGDWNMIDNMVVSGALINKTKGLKSALDNGFVFHEPFMEFVNNQGQMSPNRTYGRSYYGGISDHFPVYLVLE